MPYSATPSDPIPTPHERGVFRDEVTFPGLITYRLYNCMGDLVEVAVLTESWHDADIEAELRESLGKRCRPASTAIPTLRSRAAFRLICCDSTLPDTTLARFALALGLVVA